MCDKITECFDSSGAVDRFREAFGIPNGKDKLACTMLYHEVMWDLIDMLLNDSIITYPKLWTDRQPGSVYSVVIYEK